MLRPIKKGHGNCAHIANCADCKYVSTVNSVNKPLGYFAVVKRARLHAKHNPGHTVTATDMTCLETVARYHFDALPGMGITGDDPAPF